MYNSRQIADYQEELEERMKDLNYKIGKLKTEIKWNESDLKERKVILQKSKESANTRKSKLLLKLIL